METQSRILSRRRFIQGVAVSCGSLALFGLAGCSGAPEPANNEQEADDAATNPQPSANESEEAATASPAPSENQLVLVFSRAGENYNVGVVETGNTMVVAQMIQEAIGADLFEIEPESPYPQSYEETKAIAQEEQSADARPAVKALPDLSGYDTVFLGFPIWWGDAPMPFYTAVEGLDWEGKTIAPFNTHAGSGDGGVFQRLGEICEGATVLEGLSIPGVTAQRDRTEARDEVDAWLASLPID